MTLLSSIGIATLSWIAGINRLSMRDRLYGCINNQQSVCKERIIEKNVNNEDIVVIVCISG
jgi:hypothetical protein